MSNARPFLKWAGGKRQLMNDLVSRLPKEVTKSKTIPTYVEPFVGGGSFFFYLQNYYNIDESVIIDINPDLVLAYKTIKSHVKELIVALSKIQTEYLALDETKREKYFYIKRAEFNEVQKIIDYDSFSESWVERTSLVIFLNRTCFNGLFRQNRKGEFNVPFGKYKNPTICDSENLIEVSMSLKKTTILCGDFQLSEKFISKGTLIYLDPPYRPLKKTTNFTSYTKEGFTDEDQRRLADYYKKMDKIGANLILSNSDPHNSDLKDNFFESLYKKFYIKKVRATRNINSKSENRGSVSELMITNYQ